MDLPISNVVNVSVSQSPAGIGAYNTSNSAIFSHEAYNSTFGSDPYKLYYDPTDVAKDFGSDSLTYALAVAMFSQSPNLRTGSGYLTIIPIVPETELITLSAVPDAGATVISFNGANSASIAFNDTLDVIQTKLRAVAGLGQVVVSGSLAALSLKINGTFGDQPQVTLTSNTLTHTSTPVTAVITSPVAAETVLAAIQRMVNVVNFFGVAYTQVLAVSPMQAIADYIQSQDKMLFVVSQTPADVEVGGLIDTLRSGSRDHSRGLFYGASSLSKVMGFLGAYMGRALSTNFSGSLTTQTMHLKDLATVDPDPSMTPTLYAKCQAAGADIYASIQGVSKTLTSGANRFFDQVYNQLWFVGAIKVAGFNYLATISTKIPQTEAGVDGLRKAYRNVCEQAVANGYAAPGTWNSAIPFGDPETFLANIAEKGYYIYTAPLSQQSAADRVARKAPVAQIAIKEAGATHESDVIVNINP